MTKLFDFVKRALPLLLLLLSLIFAMQWALQRTELARLKAENEQLKQERLAPWPQPSEPQTPSPEPVPVAPPRPEEEPLVPTPTGMASPPRASGLHLADSRLETVPEGLRVVLRFSPDITEPLGIIAVVVRLPDGSESRITGLAALHPTELTEVSKRVADDGKFAVFQGTSNRAEEMELALTVSGATTADLRGTCGIGPLKLEITPQGVVTRSP